MTWSTRELADLAGTTTNTVRHYHALGLLPEPDRSYNGYKRYQAPHLVQLLRLRRLVALGLPLAQIGTRNERDEADVLERTDELLKEKIHRMEQSRSDIAEILRTGAPVDTPRGFESVGARLSEADRSLLHICVQTHSSASLARLQTMVAIESSEVQTRIRALTPDSSEATRERLADRLARSGAHWRSLAWIERDSSSGIAPSLSRVSEQVFAEALRTLYSPVQNEVFRRADARLLVKAPTPTSGSRDRVYTSM